MKKFNTLIIVFFFLFIAALGSYIYFLEGFTQSKELQKDIESLQKIKQNIQKPVIVKADSNMLRQKTDEYREVVQKLEVDASVIQKEKSIEIYGAIGDTYDYMMVKRILNIIQNDAVKVEKICLGVGCNENRYGFFINFTPYTLTYR